MNWQDLIKYSSVQMAGLDEQGNPIGIGSGCLLDIGDHRLLLTVFHVVNDSSSWCVPIRFDELEQKTEVLFLNQFNHIYDLNEDKSGMVNVEFSFHPVRATLKLFTSKRERNPKVDEIIEIPVLKETDIGEPNRTVRYGFSGNIRAEYHPDVGAFFTDNHIYHGLEYIRTENNLHVFKMPDAHPGHEYFKGCSGAPIIGEDGRVVSLVSSGSIEKKEIYGATLSKCIRTLNQYLR